MENLFSEGLVRQPGYEDEKCKFVKLDDEKTVYLVEDINVIDGMYVVSTDVSEALKRKERKTIGIINDEKKTIIPFVNSDVVKINEEFIAIGRSDEKQDEDGKVKEKLEREIDGDIEFIVNSEDKVYDIYKVVGKNLELIFEKACYVVKDSDNIYVHNSDVNGSLVAIVEKEKKSGKVNESKPQMPVETFAKVNEKMVDSLETPSIEEQKEGAPELKEEEEVVEEETTVNSDYFQISDIKNVSPILGPKPDKKEEEELKVEIPVENSEPTPKKEGEEKKIDDTEIENQMADIASLISSARGTYDELIKENESKDSDIEKYRATIEDLEKKVTSLEEEVSLGKEKSEKQSKVIEELQFLKDEQNKKIDNLTNENKTLTEDNDKLSNKVSNYEDSFKQLYGELYDAFGDTRKDGSKTFTKAG